MIEHSSTQKLRQIPYLFPRRFGARFEEKLKAEFKEKFETEFEAWNLNKNLGRNILSKAESSKDNIKDMLHLYGAPKVGKTSFALYLAHKYSNPFYINFNDMRNMQDSIKNILFKISMEKRNDLLILDNCPLDWSIFPQNLKIITINESPIQHLNQKSLLEKPPNIIQKQVFALSFEEFLSFDRSNKEVNQLFDSFFKYGNLPEIINIKGVSKIERKQEILRNIFGEDLAIFRHISRLQGRCVTPNQIYNSLKKHLKISKDKVYRLLNEWQSRGIVAFIQEIGSKNMPKKLFFWDFTITNALTYERNFIASVENMLFLELISQKKSIYYNSKFHLICENIGYVIMPFSPLEEIKHFVATLDNLEDIKSIVVITFAINSEFEAHNRIIIVRNFIDFALGENEP